jgi:hypothetical protein
MAVRETTKTKTKMAAEVPEPEQDQFSQRKRPDDRRYRLQVDRQTKGSYTTPDAAEEAGLAIKQGFPILQVAVYDAVDGVNKLIELPTT